MATIYINQQGVVEGVYSDSLVGLYAQGDVEVKRASHVEPGFTAQGAPCWYADLSPSGGPQLGPFQLRQEALDAEVAWLHANLFNGTMR